MQIEHRCSFQFHARPNTDRLFVLTPLLFVTSQLGLLRSVTYLSLLNNTLLGPLPDALAGMTSLSSLNLGANLLYGTLPSSLGGLIRLQQLQLDRNALLNGTIPASYGNLVLLSSGGLSVVGTGVCGSPPLLGGQIMPSILPFCAFFPAVGTERDAMNSIRSAWSSIASWTAADPCSGAWGGVTCDGSGHITSIRLRSDSSNSYGDNLWGMSSTVPSALGSLTRLTSLELVGLGLFGFLPPEIGRLTELTTLVMATYVNYNVNDNAYSSSCQYTNMYPGTSTIWLTDNGNGISYLNGYPGSLLLLGGIPSSWGALTNLRTLNISLGGCLGLPVVINRFYSDVNYGTFNSTNLSGDFQEALGSLTSLRHLDLRGNQFLCGLPTTIGRLSNLTALIASGNRLAGVLPSEMGRLRALSLLDLASNRLNGCARAARTRRHARTVDLGVCDDGGRRDSETASG